MIFTPMIIVIIIADYSQQTSFPTLISGIELDGSAYTLEIQNDFVYVADLYSFRIIDARNILTPKLVKTIYFEGIE